MIDARIALMGQQADPLMAVQNGSNLAANFQKNKEYLKNEPLRDKLMQLRLQGQEQGVQMNQQKIQQQQILGIAQRIKPFLDAQTPEGFQQAQAIIASSNLPQQVKQEALQADQPILSGFVNQALQGASGRQRISKRTVPYANGTSQTFYSDGSIEVRDPTGTLLDGQDAEVAMEEAVKSGALVKGDEAYSKTKNTNQADIEDKPTLTRLTGDEEVVTDAKKKKSIRLNNSVSAGLDAADAMATVKRSLQLLEYVGTGGIDNASLYFKQIFGVEGADEGELSANLGKAVLSQLRATFGAAFTEREGARLERIEAGFGKSPATNKRLLSQLMKILTREAERGIRASTELGDEFSANEIKSSMKFDLTPIEEIELKKPKIIKFDSQGNPIND